MPTGNAPVASVLQTEWFTCSIGHESGQVRGTRTHPAGFTGLNAAGYIITWALPRGLAPRPSAFARRHARLLHLGSCPAEGRKTFASCRCCPDPCGLEDRHARCYINDAGLIKVVAEFGIAPNSPRLQRGANLSQLFSRCGNWSLHEVTLLGLPIINRRLCF